jgi:hypothetical protein
MGASFCVVFEREVPPHGTLGADHPALMRAQRKLDRLAADAGLTPLEEFESYQPADMADFLDDEEVEALPPAQWFAAADGRRAVRALADYLRSNPAAVPKSSEVIAELADVEAELADAQRARVRFRFAVVP